MHKKDLNPVDYVHAHESMLRFAEHLALQGLSLRSCQGYYRAISLIGRFHDGDPAAVDEEGLRRYFVHIKCQQCWAPKTIRQTLSAAKRFYRGTLKRPCAVLDEIVAKDRESLPEVLSPDEVRRIFRHLRRRRYRTPLLLCYSSGVRIGEAVRVRVDDVLGLDGKLLVRAGKGGKDHHTILAGPVHHELKRHWSLHRNPAWIFPEIGRGGPGLSKLLERMGRAARPMNIGAIQVEFARAVEAAGITCKVHPHTLRHSFATRLIESGVPVTQVQEYLGHAYVETTAIYTHLTPVCHRKALDCIHDMIEPLL